MSQSATEKSSTTGVASLFILHRSPLSLPPLLYVLSILWQMVSKSRIAPSTTIPAPLWASLRAPTEPT
ncbi:hypothetical protein PAXRUDRAFT_496109 [Paxillus rubicundulus Ve08.2h10]|uniref:Uncharacterized protein n=1 Tax=Paxillus rubicundulus Ve08.2h10 TaxID=930991 RepID=A0A0D0DVT7_9AGAM|nr:hypothetical protein PAXRUDRAFT_496109 [Paxillus rubicundulus Ve08.2h10]